MTSPASARWLCGLVVSAFLLGCGSSEPAFGRKFLLGSAIAGFQSEMGCPSLPAEQCEDRNSDWYAFVTRPEFRELGDILSGDPPSSAPGYWELFDEDHRRAREEVGLGALRLSIEWSRVFPRPTDSLSSFEELRAHADPRALAHYHAIFASLRARGLEPLVTLNHYTLPLWLHDAPACKRDLDTCQHRGWLDRERAVREIAKFAGFCAQEFGGEVDLWATLNEPMAVVLPGYLLPSHERANPPGLSARFSEARRVAATLVEAHARMYDAVKAADTLDADGDRVTSQVGLVYAVAPVRPRDPDSELDRKAAQNVFYLFSQMFLDGAIRGDLDENLRGPHFATHREDLVGRMDYLGINYYTQVTVSGIDSPAFPTLSPLTNLDPFSIEFGQSHPRGLYDVVMFAKERYGLPMLITENGAANPDDGPAASEYLVRHLGALKQAMRDGADVRGYFWWTLTDNYEWNHGMNVRMGLYAVDKEDPSKQRTARGTVATFREISRQKDVPLSLARQYPEP